MFNFLPKEYKKRAKNEYKIRLLTVMFLLFSTVALVSVILAVPAYVAAKNHYAQALSEKTQSSNTVESSKTGNALVSVQKVSAYISSAQSLVPLSADSIVEPIVLARPTGVTVTSISVSVGSGGLLANVIGVASTRSGLISFVKNLQGVGRLGTFNLPVGLLAQDTNISYQIEIPVKNIK